MFTSNRTAIIILSFALAPSAAASGFGSIGAHGRVIPDNTAGRLIPITSATRHIHVVDGETVTFAISSERVTWQVDTDLNVSRLDLSSIVPGNEQAVGIKVYVAPRPAYFGT